MALAVAMAALMVTVITLVALTVVVAVAGGADIDIETFGGVKVVDRASRLEVIHRSVTDIDIESFCRVGDAARAHGTEVVLCAMVMSTWVDAGIKSLSWVKVVDWVFGRETIGWAMAKFVSDIVQVTDLKV